MQDRELIRAYVESGDEAAFAELAGRQLNLAYSAARLATREQARATVLDQKAENGSATLPELQEALHLSDDRAIIAAADRLQTLGPVAHEALPDLLQALDVKQSMASFNIAQILKEWAPEQLAARLKQKNAPNLYEIVTAVGELGAPMSYVLPDLEALLANIPPTDYGMIQTVGEAIQRINPGYPKMVYNFNDLHEPFAA